MCEGDEFAEIRLEMREEQCLKLLVGHVQLVLRVSAPVHRVLIDGNVDGVLNVLLNQLLVQLAILLEVLLERGVHIEALLALQ